MPRSLLPRSRSDSVCNRSWARCPVKAVGGFAMVERGVGGVMGMRYSKKGSLCIYSSAEDGPSLRCGIGVQVNRDNRWLEIPKLCTLGLMRATDSRCRIYFPSGS